MVDETSVGMGQFVVKKAPHRLVSRGVGSCMIIVLIDSKAMIGGMAHAVLPKNTSNEKSPKYVNDIIDLLISEMLAQGAQKSNIIAKISGGADMFPSIEKLPTESIGLRNIEVTKETLKAQGVRLNSEDVSGTHGRSVSFDITSGIVEVTIRI